jgi:hypothetical protein
MKFRIVFWDVLPCKLIADRRFRDTCCLHHQVWWFRQHVPLERQSTIILHGSNCRPTFQRYVLPLSSGYLWNGCRQLFYTAVHPRRQFWNKFVVCEPTACPLSSDLPHAWINDSFKLLSKCTIRKWTNFRDLCKLEYIKLKDCFYWAGRCSRVINAPSTYSGAPRLKSQPGDWLCWL